MQENAVHISLTKSKGGASTHGRFLCQVRTLVWKFNTHTFEYVDLMVDQSIGSKSLI